MAKANAKTEERKVKVEQELAALSAISDEELYAKLSSSEEGLNQVEASDRIDRGTI